MSDKQQNAYLKMLSEIKTDQLGVVFSLPFIGIWRGIKNKIIPIYPISLGSLFLFFLYSTGLDQFLFTNDILKYFYPRSFIGNLVLLFLYIIFPFLFWGLIEGGRIFRFKNKLAEILTVAGLKTVLGQTPELISLHSIDNDTQKMILAKKSLALQDFIKVKARLESGLCAYIDDIKENRTSGSVEILFSNQSLPSSVKYYNTCAAEEFFIGSTRAKEIYGNLKATPHLLVAGQTGGGKSTFLRNLITTLFLNSSSMRFTLIDLKGGLEFQLFEDLPRVNVIPSLDKAIEELNSIQAELSRRIEVLKQNKVKDLNHLGKNAQDDSLLKNRRLIVVDEAAELFLAGGGADSSKIIQARRILSLIARQGRAVGINLVIATQRPDAKSIDPQVKANLSGVLCFSMQNDSSSITVLGNGRATDLPLIPGRGIWKEGPLMTEVQTPFLGMEEAENFLDPHRIIKEVKKGLVDEDHVS